MLPGKNDAIGCILKWSNINSITAQKKIITNNKPHYTLSSSIIIQSLI